MEELPEYHQLLLKQQEDFKKKIKMRKKNDLFPQGYR
jgi:hypothetical protein